MDRADAGKLYSHFPGTHAYSNCEPHYRATAYTRFSPDGRFSSTSCSSQNRISPAFSVNSFIGDELSICPR